MTETSTDGALAPELRELLERRTTLQKWLSGLDEQRGTTSERILQRVRADYEGRLAETVEALSTHVAGIQSELDRAAARSVEAEQLHEVAVDGLEEARLRHAIGELPGDGWPDRERQLMEDVKAARVAGDAARSEADRLKELLGALATTAEPDASAAAAGTTAVLQEEPAAAEVESSSSSDTAVSGGGAVGDGAGRAGAGRVDVAVDDAAPVEDAGAGTAGVDTEATVESAPSTSDSEVVAPAAEEKEQGRVYLERVSLELQAESLPNEAPGLFDADDIPSPEKAPPPGLKCAECGYTNDLSAWFCGVCGADVG